VKKTIFIFLLLISNVFSQSAEIVLLNHTLGGDGTYDNPYILDTDEVRWKHSISGSNKETAKYMTCIHASTGRACILCYKKDNIDFTTMQGMNHNAKLFCGTYYIRTHVNEKMTSKIFIHCRVPPVDPYSVPYNPPAANVSANPSIKMNNVLSGSGSWSDPYVIAGQVAQFYVKDSRDANGIGDIQNGAWFWAIVTDGWHPIYSHGERLKDIKATFSYFDELDDLQQWNTQERLSETGQYKLTLYFFDRHGERSLKTIQFTCNGAVPPPPSELMVTPPYLDFDESMVVSAFTVNNNGGSDMKWNAVRGANSPWIKSITPSSGTLDAGIGTEVLVRVDRSGLTDGIFTGSIAVSSEGLTKKVVIDLTVDLPPVSPMNLNVVIRNFIK